MANPTRPTAFPLWTQGNPGQRIQPTSGQQFTGFNPGMRPSSYWHNWLWGIMSDWIAWFDFITNPSSLGAPVYSAAFSVAIPQKDYLCNVSGGGFAGSLPTAASVPGSSFVVKNISLGSANSVALTPQAGDSIEGGTAGAALAIGAGDVRRVTSDGVTGWWLTIL